MVEARRERARVWSLMVAVFGCLSLVIGCGLLVLLALLAEDVLESRLVTRNFNNGRLL